jgi:hypothetical protein
VGPSAGQTDRCKVSPRTATAPNGRSRAQRRRCGGSDKARKSLPSDPCGRSYTGLVAWTPATNSLGAQVGLTYHCLDRRILPRPQTFEARLFFVIGERNLADHVPGLPRSRGRHKLAQLRRPRGPVLSAFIGVHRPIDASAPAAWRRPPLRPQTPSSTGIETAAKSQAAHK